jgi:ribose 5-phosphate isomerase A
VEAEAAKRAAGESAVALVEPGMVVGLGSGSTAYWFIAALGARVRDGLYVRGVPSSLASAALAAQQGIPLVELDRRGVDLAVDGADAVDSDLRLIKGRGGAMVREKIVAAAARRFVVVVDETKICDQLRGRLPVEVIAFGADHTLALLEGTGAPFTLREDGKNGAHVVTDNQNHVADGEYPAISDPEGLADRIQAIPGVVGHGLFLGMADLVLVGHEDGHVDQIRPAR